MAGVQPFQFEPTYSAEELEEMDIRDQSEEEEDNSNDIESRVGRIDWCLCGNCREMPTEDECYCCQEMDELNSKFDESGVDCITEHNKFDIVCLDSDVLKTALVGIHNARLNPIPDPITNRTWRLAAYRQFTWWVHGILGKKRRRVIPSCVVTSVREKFPEESGDYTGFKEAELDISN